MEHQKEKISRAVLTSAASGTNAEAFSRAIRASNSKIDAQLMISVFRSLGHSKDSTMGRFNLRKRGGSSTLGEVSVDDVVAEYAKRMLERKRRLTARRTLADYVELGADLTPEVLDAKKTKGDEMEARRKSRREGAAFSLVQRWRLWVEDEEWVHIYPFGKMPAFVAFYSAIVLGIIAMCAWKTIADQYDETRFYERE